MAVCRVFPTFCMKDHSFLFCVFLHPREVLLLTCFSSVPLWKLRGKEGIFPHSTDTSLSSFFTWTWQCTVRCVLLLGQGWEMRVFEICRFGSVRVARQTLRSHNHRLVCDGKGPEWERDPGGMWQCDYFLSSLTAFFFLQSSAEGDCMGQINHSQLRAVCYREERCARLGSNEWFWKPKNRDRRLKD